MRGQDVIFGRRYFHIGCRRILQLLTWPRSLCLLDLQDGFQRSWEAWASSKNFG